MQAPDKNIQDHLGGLATGYHRQRQQSITEELLDIGGSSWFEPGALPVSTGPTHLRHVPLLRRLYVHLSGCPTVRR
jgi:hypothetical protein